MRLLYELPLRNTQQDEQTPKYKGIISELPGLEEGLLELDDLFKNGIPRILNFLSNLSKFNEVIGLAQESYKFQEHKFIR